MRTSLLSLEPKTTKVIPVLVKNVLRFLQTLPGYSNDFHHSWLSGKQP
jgi:hypothetical protein